METPTMDGIDNWQMQTARWIEDVGGCTTAMGMYYPNALFLHNLLDPLLHFWIKSLLALNHMTLHPHSLQSTYHLTMCERQADWFISLTIHKIDEVEQMGFSTSYLSLPNHLQYFYLLTHG